MSEINLQKSHFIILKILFSIITVTSILMSYFFGIQKIQYSVCIFSGANRGSLVSMGKPTSSTLANLAGIFKEKDERAVSQAPDGQARPDERYNECESPEKDAIQKVMVSKLAISK